MRDRRYPPGPSLPQALIGMRDMNGGRDLKGVAEFFGQVAGRYGRIAHWNVLGRHFFLLDDPEFIEEVLVFKSGDYRKGRGIQRLKRLLGSGLLTSEEPLHLRRRRMIQPAFHTERIAGYGRQMTAAAVEQTATWHSGGTLEIVEEMNRLTLTIAAQTLLSADVSNRTATIRTALSNALRAFPASMSPFSELLDALPLPVTRRFEQARAQLDTVMYEIIADRRRSGAGPGDDLLAMLLDAADADGSLDDRQVRDEAMTLFIAGHETTANALAWTWYLLARHPAAAERLGAELDEVLGGRSPQAGDLPRLRFTRDVFAEALRLFPPAWALGRRALRDTTIGQYHVPRGAIVIASQLVTHRNPRFWDAPGDFAPERWSSAAPPARFAFFPFGGGSRRCIGESFAWMEGVLLIATIAQRFHLTTVDDVEIDTEPLVTLRPRTPIHLRVELREGHIPAPA